jgi:hypothetical protein
MLEGLIQVIPRKGVVVQSISLDEVLHILELRLVNEPYIAWGSPSSGRLRRKSPECGDFSALPPH